MGCNDRKTLVLQYMRAAVGSLDGLSVARNCVLDSSLTPQPVVRSGWAPTVSCAWKCFSFSCLRPQFLGSYHRNHDPTSPMARTSALAGARTFLRGDCSGSFAIRWVSGTSQKPVKRWYFEMCQKTYEFFGLQSPKTWFGPGHQLPDELSGLA